MEDRTEREGALYDRLKQVLCKYIMTQRLAYQQALAACVPVLGFQLWLMRETQDEIPSFIVPCRGDLTRAAAVAHADVPACLAHGPVPRTRTDPHWRPPSSRSCEIVRWSNLSVTATWRAFVPSLPKCSRWPAWTQGASSGISTGFIEGCGTVPPWIDYWESWAGQSSPHWTGGRLMRPTAILEEPA